MLTSKQVLKLNLIWPPSNGHNRMSARCDSERAFRRILQLMMKKIPLTFSVKTRTDRRYVLYISCQRDNVEVQITAEHEGKSSQMC